MSIGDMMSFLFKEEPNMGHFFSKSKIDMLKSQKVSVEVLSYLKSIVQNLSINIGGRQKGTLFELMNKGALEGWCFQTTETSIVFFNDDDYIGRGELVSLNRNAKYHHSWICFKYNGEEYVFDPCLNFLCKKEKYYETFSIQEKASIQAKQVRDDLIFLIENSCKNEKLDKFLNKFLFKICTEEFKTKMNATYIYGSDDINSSMYNNSTGYVAEIENNKIKKLKAYYNLL